MTVLRNDEKTRRYRFNFFFKNKIPFYISRPLSADAPGAIGMFQVRRRMRGRQLLQQSLPRRAACAANFVAYWLLTCPPPPRPPRVLRRQVLAEKAKTATHPAAKAVAKHAAAKSVSHAKSKENYGADILQVCVCLSVRACAAGFARLLTTPSRGPAHESRFGPCATFCMLRVLCGASPVQLRRPSPDGVPVSRIVPR